MRARVYRNLGRRAQYYGLEPVDAVALATVLWALLTFNRGALAINALATAIAYVALRVLKRGKPAGYTTDLVRYALSSRSFLSAAEPDVTGRGHPFLPRRAATADAGLDPHPQEKQP